MNRKWKKALDNWGEWLVFLKCNHPSLYKVADCTDVPDEAFDEALEEFEQWEV